MGVRGSGGVGGGVPRHRPSHIAYYVALVGILALLALLLLYFFYFFIKKVKKFSTSPELTPQPSSSCRPPPAAPAYPVQPVVREGASEMAKLCKQLPPPGRSGTVFPTSTSPAAIRTDTGAVPPGPLSLLDGTAPPPPAASDVPAASQPSAHKPAPPITVTAPTECVAAQ